jgi:uncharacterized protein YyaL (SSP411 family)
MVSLPGEMNRLSNEKSAYLRHSAYQKIDWYPWSEEAFEKAKEEDKPVFLSSGAIWCHWCHVMAKECFEDDDVVKLLNENFINIKLDRDERPDIDRGYQHAVAAMGSGGGWPLSVFLTPDKKPFFGGTYFPPEDMQNRPGFKKVLITVSDFYKSKKEEVFKYADRLIDFLRPKSMLHNEIKEAMLDEAVTTILSEFDPQNGGFGSVPKFPSPGSIEFLINRYFFVKNESIKLAVEKTLEAMAKGGFHDQIGGGFHRYSTDEAWIIPHFEKMADDNAWLLRNYVNGYRLFGDRYFKEVAEGIINFIKHVLSDPEGGFYASQDADVTPDDEGGYFTWTDEDIKSTVSDEEYRILSLHLLHERGSMHHDRAKNVLFVAMEPAELSKETGIEEDKVIGLILSGKKKLLEKRKTKEQPFIDRTLYTSLNGMLISSYLLAYRVLKDNYLKEFALLSLDRILKKYFLDNKLYHSEGVNALIDDYIYIIDALISAYEITGDISFLKRADEITEICISKFWDEDDGGFFDTSEDIIGIRFKGIEDVPHPSANSIAIILLLKLNFMTKKESYKHYTEKSLKVLYLRARDLGIHSGYYFCALDAYFNMYKFTLEASPESALTDKALSVLIPYLSILYKENNGRIIPCKGTQCYEPIYNPEGIREFFKMDRASIM